jgi:hypothetical protein
MIQNTPEGVRVSNSEDKIAGEGIDWGVQLRRGQSEEVPLCDLRISSAFPPFFASFFFGGIALALEKAAWL